MKRLFSLLFFVTLLHGYAQERNVNKLTLESTYSYKEVHKSLRDLVDANPKEKYFDDDFFNDLLKKIASDNQFTEEEKAKLFYLLFKKIGYAFVGVEYIPPKQNYFTYHQGKVYILQKTKAVLKDLNYNISALLQIVDSNYISNPILASNALLLSTLLNPDNVLTKLKHYSQSDVIMQSKNPDIFNHYVCLSASLAQDTLIRTNLEKNLTAFTKEGFLEDVFCALYSKNNPVAPIKTYITKEKNPLNNLAIETALCALSDKVPPASFHQSVNTLMTSAKEKWKNDLLKNILAKKIPYNYSLTSKDQLVTKVWDGVVISSYLDGILISNGSLMEFDPN
jgi:hypothetical protein